MFVYLSLVFFTTVTSAVVLRPSVPCSGVCRPRSCRFESASHAAYTGTFRIAILRIVSHVGCCMLQVFISPYYVTLTLRSRPLVNPFPAGLEYTRVGGMPRVAGRPDGPCDQPVTPAHRSKASGGRGWVSPRGPQASLGSFRRSARTLALAVRVV